MKYLLFFFVALSGTLNISRGQTTNIFQSQEECFKHTKETFFIADNRNVNGISHNIFFLPSYFYESVSDDALIPALNKQSLSLLSGKDCTTSYSDSISETDSDIIFNTGLSNTQNLLTSSNLPIVIIDTYGQVIQDELKVKAFMRIIDNGNGKRNSVNDNLYTYNGYIGIELRGSSSQILPKKSYSIKTLDTAGNDSDAVILDMPSESDWCLIANYSDKTMLRNFLTYNLSSLLGYYAPRTKYCELMVNNIYQGVYLLTEKIIRNLNRIDIAKLKPNEISGNDLTGGYIIKIDKQNGNSNDGWISTYPSSLTTKRKEIFFKYEYPKNKNLAQQQKDYIKAYVDSFETALNSSYFADTLKGYRHYININSFIDYFILNEISKNVDGYRLNTFLYKDNIINGGKLNIGPIWDFDIAWDNANYCSANEYTGWAYKFSDICPNDISQPPNWWQCFMQDSNFTTKLKCRWEYLRTNIFDTLYLYHFIDSVATYIDEGEIRNFKKWQILGAALWNSPAPIPTSYNEEIIVLKEWIRNRIDWLDKNIPGNCFFNYKLTEKSKKAENLSYPKNQ